MIEISKLTTYGTGAYDNERFRLFLGHHSLAVVNDFFAINWNIWQSFGARSCRNNYIICLISGHGTLIICHFYLLAASQLPCPIDHVYFILLHQELDSLAHSVRHIPGSLYHCCEICRSLLDRDAIVLGMAEIIKHFSTLDECLSGYAAPVEAYPSKRLSFNDSRLQT